jgi:hypothetical protein
VTCFISSKLPLKVVYIRFVYDLQIPHGLEEVYIPKPFDGEVESFQVYPFSGFQNNSPDII